MNQEIYLKVFIPRYKELWKIVHDAGKKLLFCADGNFMKFAGYAVEAGADALISFSAVLMLAISTRALKAGRQRYPVFSDGGAGCFRSRI